MASSTSESGCEDTLLALQSWVEEDAVTPPTELTMVFQGDSAESTKLRLELIFSSLFY